MLEEAGAHTATITFFLAGPGEQLIRPPPFLSHGCQQWHRLSIPSPPASAAWAFFLPTLETLIVIPQHPRADMTNLCTNCKHHHDDGSMKFADRCIRPDNGINPVNGQIISRYCEKERFHSRDGTCGPSGIFFEPRSTLNAVESFNARLGNKQFQVGSIDILDNDAGPQC